MGARAIWESSILQQPHHKSQPSPSPSPSHRNEQRTVYSALLNTFIDPGDSISISEFPSKLLRLRPFAISISEIHRSCIFSAARTGQDDISLPLLSTYTIHILPPLNCCRSQPIAIRSSRRAAHCRGDIDLFFSSKRSAYLQDGSDSNASFERRPGQNLHCSRLSVIPRWCWRTDSSFLRGRQAK